ncbi:MAG: toprim domain-containing protein, partial [Oscillospiraceae bacterium]|nr:toprim domain-containing protein [Oscillospiraceae bacterium]
MLHVKQAVIVEGKYDKIKLSSVIDGVIIPTDGFNVFKNKETLALIRYFAETTGIIILTDSDAAGFKIRSFLKGAVGGKGEILNVYVPDIFGKERRKTAPSKEGKLGVEGMEKEIILEAFRKAGIAADDGSEQSDRE